MPFDKLEIRRIVGQAIACHNDDEVRNEINVNAPFGSIYNIDQSDLLFMQEQIAIKMNGLRKHVPLPKMSETPQQYTNRLNQALNDIDSIRELAKQQFDEYQSKLQQIAEYDSIQNNLKNAEKELDLYELNFRERRTEKVEEIQRLSNKLRELKNDLQRY